MKKESKRALEPGTLIEKYNKARAKRGVMGKKKVNLSKLEATAIRGLI